MIEESQKIIVKRNNNNIHMLGSGFTSHKEIEDEIKNRFEMHPGEYSYGTLNKINSITLEKQYPKTKSYTEIDENKFKSIEKNAGTDERIESYSEHRLIRRYPNLASIYGQNIRYKEGEVDFSLKIRNDLFDKVPVSTLDKKIEKKIMNIFEDVVDKDAIYMGYESTYAARGRRKPFVRVYGRLKRDSDEDRELRKLYSLDFIEGIYWSLDNITPIPIYTRYNNEQKERKDKVDVIAVTDYVDSKNDSYEEISKDILKEVEKYANHIEDNYNLNITEIGKTSHNKEFMTVYLGIKYNK